MKCISKLKSATCALAVALPTAFANAAIPNDVPRRATPEVVPQQTPLIPPLYNLMYSTDEPVEKYFEGCTNDDYGVGLNVILQTPDDDKTKASNKTADTYMFTHLLHIARSFAEVVEDKKITDIKKGVTINEIRLTAAENDPPFMENAPRIAVYMSLTPYRAQKSETCLEQRALTKPPASITDEQQIPHTLD